MGLRVIQWATGGVGRAAIEGVLDHPDLDFVGAWVHSADKDGRDVGELIGREPIGVRATTDAAALLATDADCVIYSPVVAEPDTLRALLRSGKNVVTPLGWFYPRQRDRERFDGVCREAGVSLHGTGIHPGGITERLPLTISALSGSITGVRAEEFSDIRGYGAPDVLRHWMMFGATPDEATAGPIAGMLAGGYSQSVWMIADTLGFALDPDLRVEHEVAVATALHAHDPGAGVERNPAIVATAMNCVNAVPYVVAAEPGVRTYLDLPLLSGRAAAALRREHCSTSK